MLTSDEIQKQMDAGKIKIENLKENALSKPNSCLLSIGDTLYTYDYQVVDTKDANKFLQEVSLDNIDKLRKVTIPESGFLLEPQKVYLAKTTEKITTNGYIPVLNGRTSLSLLGLSIELTSGYGNDFFDDNFLLSIICTKPTIIYPNIEIGNLTFFKSLDTKDEHIGMLSGEEIKQRMQKGDIIITPKDNIVINPNSVNLTLNKKIGYYTESILDLKKDNPIEYIEIGEEGLVLTPDKIYVARSNEWTKTSQLIPMISGRSSLGRLGYHAHCSASLGAIGYEGYWHMGIRPTVPIRVYENMKCCQIYFLTPVGEITKTYKGSMQNLAADKLGSQFYKKIGEKK